MSADARALVFALLIGAAGAGVFWFFQLPLAFLLGAMTATGTAALCGLRVAVPNRLRGGMIALLGATIGASFNPSLFAKLAPWAAGMVVVTVAVAVMSALAYWSFRRLGRFDRITSLFAATPGGLSVMTIAGEAMGGDPRAISLLHATRVVIVVFAVPFYLQLTEHVVIPSTAALVAHGLTLSPLGLAETAAAAALGYGLAGLARLPAAAIMGPIVVGAMAHLSGLFAAQPPIWLVAATQVVVGSAIGARFAGFSLRAMGHATSQGLLVGVATTMAAAAISLAASPLVATTPAALLLALAPGGVAEMCLVALALHIDPAFVATMHMVRLGLVLLAAPPLFRLLAGPGKSR